MADINQQTTHVKICFNDTTIKDQHASEIGPTRDGPRRLRCAESNATLAMSEGSLALDGEGAAESVRYLGKGQCRRMMLIKAL